MFLLHSSEQSQFKVIKEEKQMLVNTIEIKDYLRRYFTELTAEDLRPRNEEKRRIEIKKAINQKILKDSEIRDVRFLSLQIIEQ